MPVNANQKGKRYERKVAKLLNEKFGTNVRRTPQSGGMSIKGDIIDTDENSILSEFHFECKHQERTNIWNFFAQSRNDCPRHKTPLVVFTKNHEFDYVGIEFSDFLNILKELEELRNGRGTV